MRGLRRRSTAKRETDVLNSPQDGEFSASPLRRTRLKRTATGRAAVDNHDHRAPIKTESIDRAISERSVERLRLAPVRFLNGPRASLMHNFEILLGRTWIAVPISEKTRRSTLSG
jgi:hypothetical protein